MKFIKALPPVAPTYKSTKCKQESILDKIKADVIARYPKNYAGEPKLGGRACEFSLNQILQIIDKYKARMEIEE